MENTRPSKMKIGSNFWFLASWTGEKPFKDNVDFANTDNPWNPVFLDEVEPYCVLRFMDWNVTNLSGQKVWDTRRQKSDPKQEAGTGGMNGEPGIAYEWMIDLCNRTKCDLWLTVPHLTIEDFDANPGHNYYTELAKLVKSLLDTGLKVYVEYSNETWNTMFEQAVYTKNRGGGRFHTYAAVRLFKAFEEEFKDQPERLVKVLAGFTHSHQLTRDMLVALKDPEINPWGIKANAYALAPYIGHRLDGTSSNIMEEWNINTDQVLEATKEHARILEGTGIDLITYEGGQHLLKNADVFSRNPKIYDAYMEMLEKFNPYYSLFVHYAHCGNWASGGAWGAKEFTGQDISQAHKYRALVDWIKK